MVYNTLKIYAHTSNFDCFVQYRTYGNKFLEGESFKNVSSFAQKKLGYVLFDSTRQSVSAAFVATTSYENVGEATIGEVLDCRHEPGNRMQRRQKNSVLDGFRIF